MRDSIETIAHRQSTFFSREKKYSEPEASEREKIMKLMFEGLASFNSLLSHAMKHFPIDEGSWDKLTECLALWNFWLEWIRFSFSSKNFYNIFICLLFKFLWPSFKSDKVCCKLVDFFLFSVGYSRWEGTSQSVLSLSNNHTFFHSFKALFSEV